MISLDVGAFIPQHHEAAPYGLSPIDNGGFAVAAQGEARAAFDGEDRYYVVASLAVSVRRDAEGAGSAAHGGDVVGSPLGDPGDALTLHVDEAGEVDVQLTDRGGGGDDARVVLKQLGPLDQRRTGFDQLRMRQPRLAIRRP